MIEEFRKCARCGEKIGHRSKKYCSIRCAREARKDNSRVVRVCSYCKKEFERRYSETRYQKHDFCSKKCMGLFLRLQPTPKSEKGIDKIVWRSHRTGYFIGTVDGAVVRRSRYTVEKSLGRKLLPEESIHHKNGIRNDDCIENLELWSCTHPYGQRVSEKIVWAIDYLKKYNYKITPPYNDLEICKVVAPVEETAVSPTAQPEASPEAI